MPAAGSSSAPPVRLGLGANWRQFALLVVTNAFVGAMVGQERTLVPLIARENFGIQVGAALTAFILTFGVAKAACNLVAGVLADRVGRRRILLLGWLVGLPVPWVLAFAPSWWWIVAANVLLGVNQGLAWSMTVTMKVDLVGPARRGLALGLNECAGYLAVGVAAWASAALAASYGARPIPFAIGAASSILGLTISAVAVRETLGHVLVEAAAGATTAPRRFLDVFLETSVRNPRLFACSQAGLVNNLNDAVAWGILPLFFAARGLTLRQIGLLAAVYPAVWGVGQLATGALSDRTGRAPWIVGGMVVQALALLEIALRTGFASWLGWSAAYGVGTAMVYPTLLAAIGDVAHPSCRARALGTYRFWRDGGFVVGALGAGVLARAVSFDAAIFATAGVTLLAGVLYLLLVMRRAPAGMSAHPATLRLAARGDGPTRIDLR